MCLSSAPAPDELGVRVESGNDVTVSATWSKLAGRLADDVIDLLIHNAGILVEDTLADVDPDDVRAQFELDALAPLFLMQTLLSRLSRGAKVALFTSRMGSIGNNESGRHYGYRMSKAAPNAAGVSLAHDLKPLGVAVVIVHSGAVRTEMTAGQGMIDADESARGILRRIDELRLETTGRFLHQSGEVLPW